MTKTFAHYCMGLLLSLVLTLVPAALVWLHIGGRLTASPQLLYILLAAFAVIQLVVQLYFFLHVGDEEKPRWNGMALSFALFVVAVLVGGTLWIMHNIHG